MQRDSALIQSFKRRLSTSPAKLSFAAWTAVWLFSLWLKSGIPIMAIGPSRLDDALFLRLAHSLLAGHWLGTFDETTLAKGMFYSLFAAMACLADVRLKMAEQLLYLAVCAGLAAWVGRRAARPWLGWVLFAALAFNPLMWLPFMARAIREGIYISLSLLALGLWVAALFPTQPSPRRQARLAVLAGLAGGCFWLTREEGLWIVPAAILVFVVRVAIGAPVSTADGPVSRGTHLRTSVLFVVLPAAVAFWLTLGVVMAMNKIHYGAFETNEFHSRSFQRGYGALARIQHAQWQRYVVFPVDARKQAYAHSAAARELESFFEGEGGARWRAMSCEQMRRSACPEILSGLFMWALREAVAQAGHYHTGADALRFYDRLADEIDAACAAGKMACLPPRATLAPPFRWEYISDSGPALKNLLSFVFRMGHGSVGSGPSSGSPEQLEFFSGMTGGPLAPAETPPIVSGWVASKGPRAELAVYDASGKLAQTADVEYLPASDVERVLPGWTSVRFRIPTRCEPNACVLRARAASDALEVSLRTGDAQSAGGQLKLYIDSLGQARQPAVVEAREQLQQKAAAIVARLYAATFPYLTLAACAGVVAALARQRTRQDHAALIALALACLTAVATRIALLAYLDVSSIPSANGSYATPASPMVVVFAVLGIWLGVAALRRRES